MKSLVKASLATALLALGFVKAGAALDPLSSKFQPQVPAPSVSSEAGSVAIGCIPCVGCSACDIAQPNGTAEGMQVAIGCIPCVGCSACDAPTDLA